MTNQKVKHKSLFQGQWLTLAGSIVLAGLTAAVGANAQAQVESDNTLGTSVSASGRNFQITGGTRVGNRNLFHSFQRFDVPARGTATFLNDASVTNIFSRVTGGTRSDIQGIIRAQGTANLFLINPSGILFGPNAQLDIGGSFIGTTANEIQFPSGGSFSLTSPVNPTDTLLTVNPSAFLFAPGTSQPNSIQASRNSRLEVDPGRSIVLLGGDVEVTGGRLLARGGRIELGGLANQGTVGLAVEGPVGNELRLQFPQGTARANVSLANSASADVTAGSGGSIAVNAANITLSRSNLFAGIQSGQGSAAAQAGDITLNATGATLIEQGSRVENNINGTGRGNGGDITVQSSSLDITNGAKLSADVIGQGNAGDIRLTIAGPVRITTSSNNTEISSQVAGNAVGSGGDITINAESLSIVSTSSRAGARINIATGGIGNAGTIKIEVDGAVLLQTVPGQTGDQTGIRSQARAGAVGGGGDVTINAASLSILNSAEITANTSSEPGTGDSSQRDAGDITVRVSGPVTITNSGRIRSNVGREGKEGNGGDIVIEASSFSATGGGYVEASTSGVGNAGSIRITAPTGLVELSGRDDERRITSRLSTGTQEGAGGQGGDITVIARELRLSDGAVLNARSQSAQQGGDITVEAQTVNLSGGGQLVSTAFSQGAAGNINIRNTEQLRLSGNDPKYQDRRADAQTRVGIPNGVTSINEIIFSDGADSGLLARSEGQGAGGEITINAGQVLIEDGAVISTDTAGAGKGGPIQVNANALTLNRRAEITSLSRGTGDAGNIDLDVRNQVLPQALEANAASSTSSRSNLQPGQLLIQNGASISADTEARGRGGSVRINTESLRLNSNARLSAEAAGEGNAGSINANAQAITLSRNSSISTAVSNPNAAGQGGSINLRTRSLLLNTGSQLSAETSGRGRAGNVSVRNANLVNLNNSRISTAVNLGANVTVSGPNQGGSIDLQTRNLSLTSNARLSAETAGRGDAGSINVRNAQAITLSRNSSISTAVSGTNAVGQGGDIRLQTGSMTLNSGAEISARSQGNGNAGRITINASGPLQATNSNISTAADQATGGSITIQARNIRLQGNSDITTDVTSGSGSGGNIFLQADTILAFADSDIIASAAEGAGGNITLATPIFFGFRYQPNDPNSAINSNTKLDGNGRVDINASGTLASGTISLPDISFLQNGLTQLPANLIDTSTLIANSCIARSQQQAGNFLITGAGSLPLRPGDTLSPYPTGGVRSIPARHNAARSWQPGDPIVEPAGAYRLANGQVMLSRECTP
ncbi:filamentous hemagglutinin N-terminal domain-containing protein [Leptolyngbya sp. FACHB-261]|uniref:two-partner secretion domain-containing protein n=1 Tax=Leptolyngbya sp. FACHB-261 TaxID=2692806 RepID=UPI001689E5C6|nr:filamentous hemagglutinin N-terminal domain-containing protein [Leptolyngbya sp. FACHB-261]MBD2102240.1 filamentous hemagglutinin N-terminal domain-containing protein [Leptolyngbya sp. FACHB-261]